MDEQDGQVKINPLESLVMGAEVPAFEVVDIEPPPVLELPKPLPAKAKDRSPRESPRPPEARSRSIPPARVPMPMPPKPEAKTSESIVEDWFRAHFHNTMWTGNSHIYNKLHEAKKDLINRLRKEVNHV